MMASNHQRLQYTSFSSSPVATDHLQPQQQQNTVYGKISSELPKQRRVLEQIQQQQLLTTSGQQKNVAAAVTESSSNAFLSGLVRHLVAKKTDQGALLQKDKTGKQDVTNLGSVDSATGTLGVICNNQKLPQERESSNTDQKATVNQKTGGNTKDWVISDGDKFYDNRELQYRKELEAYEALCKELEDSKSAETGYGWAETVVNFFAGEDMDIAAEKKNKEAIVRRAKPVLPRFRTATLVTVGLRQVLEQSSKIDRYCFDVLNAHDNKMFMASVISGYEGPQMAEYARKTLPGRLQNVISASPSFLIQNSLRIAFEQLELDLKTRCDGASEMQLLEPLNMGLYILTVLIDPGSITVANIGNCKAVISRDGSPYLLSMWHGADSNNEQRLLMQTKRREQNTVQCRKKQDVPRKVRGISSIPFWATSTLGFDTITSDCLIKGLAPVTRSLGHFALKTYGLLQCFDAIVFQDPSYGRLFSELKGASGYPYIYNLPSTAVFPRTKYDEFLILGTGGFWEFIEEKEDNYKTSALLLLLLRCFDTQAVAIVREEIVRLLIDEDGEVAATKYSQIAADTLVARALENFAAQKRQDDKLKLKDMTVVVIPLNVQNVAGIPRLKQEILDMDVSKEPILTRLKRKLMLHPEDVINTADYRTKLRWLYERKS